MKVSKKIISKLFSIKNNYTHKVITIFGIKLKFKSKKLLKKMGLNYNTKKTIQEHIFKILTFWIPIKSVRKTCQNKLLVFSKKNNPEFKVALKRLKRKLNGVNYCLTTMSIPYETVLFQRPQHLFTNFANQGICSIYIEYNYKELYKEVSSNLIIIDLSLFMALTSEHLSKCYLLLISTVHFLNCDELVILKDKGVKIVYEYLDELSEQISSSEQIGTLFDIFNNLDKLEPVLLIATAQKLYDELKDKHPNIPILLSNNAVDVNHFNAIDNNFYDAEFQEILEKNKPIIGYYGAMAGWIDWELINTITEKRKDLEFVFIGNDYYDNLKRLKIRDNVHFLGAKPYSILQNYATKFDCCIIPFGDDDVARSTSPLKMYEYMAMKKPIIVTDNLKECHGYNGVYTSHGIDEFEQNIDKALNECNENIKNDLYNYALNNTWQQRATDIIKCLQLNPEHSLKKKS